jgi:hypothetical protein
MNELVRARVAGVLLAGVDGRGGAISTSGQKLTKKRTGRVGANGGGGRSSSWLLPFEKRARRGHVAQDLYNEGAHKDKR